MSRAAGWAGRGVPGRSRSRSQGGMVTVELAFASLGASLACILLAWVLAVVGLLVRCQDTAAEVARQAARSDESAVSRALADRPAGARVTIDSDEGQVVVRVALLARPWSEWLPPVPLTAQAAVLREPS